MLSRRYYCSHVVVVEMEIKLKSDLPNQRTIIRAVPLTLTVEDIPLDTAADVFYCNPLVITLARTRHNIISHIQNAVSRTLFIMHNRIAFEKRPTYVISIQYKYARNALFPPILHFEWSQRRTVDFLVINYYNFATLLYKILKVNL